MLIVKMTGGLGNQMFQYAFYKTLFKQGKEVVIDNTTFKKNHEHEELGIGEVFDNVRFKTASHGDITKMADLQTDFLSKVRRNVFGMRRTHIQDNTVTFNDDMLRISGDCYLEGYWQSKKYFETAEADILRDFSFKPLASARNRDICLEMDGCNSVAVHVRKGKDFQSRSRVNICDANYYREAVEMIRTRVSDPVFYVFSDNPQWCRENLDFFDGRNIDWNPSSGKNGYLDMQLMSACKHNIIANSSYSWWSAFLNPSREKHVIAPHKWFNDNTTIYNIDDILPVTWTAI